MLPAEVPEEDAEPVSAFTRLNEYTFKRKIESSSEKFDLAKKPLFIGVTGGTASGKTSLCEIIKEEFGDRCCIVTFDNFYRGLTDE